MGALVRYIEKQEALDKIGRTVNERIDAVLAKTPERQKLLDFLHGVWLGHPLHPVLVSVPIGCWSFAALIDLLSFGHQRQSRSATGAIAVGIAGAAAAMPAGLADWKDLTDQQRRIGLGHAALNSVALSFYVLSLSMRLLGAGPARLFGLMGFGVASASAFLGGDLVYRLQAGVAHLADAEPPENLHLSVGDLELGEREMKRIDANGFPLLVAKVDGKAYALVDVCSHLGCSLAAGELGSDRVTCNCHGSQFALRDGRVLRGPATAPVQTFEVMSTGIGFIVRPGGDGHARS